MEQGLWDRFKAWVCSKIGHDPHRNDHSEWCGRCLRVLSTAHSRKWRDQ